MFYYDNLAFRPIEERDIEHVRQIRNDQTTWQYLTDAEMINQVNQKNWYEKMSKDSSMQYYAIIETVSNFPIQTDGLIGFVRIDCIDVKNRSMRVGFDIHPKKRRKGYGTKTMLAIQEYCFNSLGAHRLWLCVLEDNKVAKTLYDNTGFKEEGKYKESVWRDGKYKNYIIMSILEDEYRNKK